ncbi:MAG: Lrp/AsnC family transcriptional regulator [Euryarchaeota archaeon]|nr:Lrp/AsnC family transcriptional regulator [Euryarchaeota archaeon]
MLLKPLDWAILRELLRWEGNQPEGALRFPVRELAQRTQSHPNTVRARLGALRKGGVVEGAYFDPWPRLVGLVRVGWMFHGFRPGGAERAAELLREFPSVSGAPFGIDWMFPHFWETTDEAAAARANAFAARVGATRHERHFTSSQYPPSPADRLAPSGLDFRLMLALRRKPTRSLAAVARELRSTARTVERRAARLYRAGAGGMFPMVRPSRIEGALLVHYRLVRGDERAAGSLAKAFPDRLAGPFGRGINAGVMGSVANLAEAEELRHRAEGLPGIDELEILPFSDIAYPSGFASYLEGHVASLQGAVAPR